MHENGSLGSDFRPLLAENLQDLQAFVPAGCPLGERQTGIYQGTGWHAQSDSDGLDLWSNAIGTSSWDDHRDVRSGIKKHSNEVDLPVSGLIKDLKQRGLLDETLVVWSSEMGRSPILNGKIGTQLGRDCLTLARQETLTARGLSLACTRSLYYD